MATSRIAAPTPGAHPNDLARRADHLRPEPVDIVDDGLTDDEIAAGVERWLAELRSAPGVVLPVSAADELAAARRDNDVGTQS